MSDHREQLPTSTERAPESGLLQLEGVTKYLGGQVVVDNLSLSVREGEFVSILGPSGCGKTTTLRIIAGFVKPDRGHLLLKGKSLDDVPSHKRGAAMVFQNYALFPHLTVEENVAFGPRMHRVAKSEARSRVERALDLVRLPQLAGRYPRELSGGQQQRVALARAIALNPELLLLDEPLSNLDAKLRKELRSELLDIQRQSGLTTLFVTHDIEEAFAISDRVAVMNLGCIEQYGPPVEIFTAARTRFVADFVGHVNFVEGPVATDDDGIPWLAWNAHRLRIPESQATDNAQFFIPNHALKISTHLTPSSNCFPAKVLSRTYLGSLIQFRLQLGGHVLNCDAAAASDLLDIHEGAEVFASWDLRDMTRLGA